MKCLTSFSSEASQTIASGESVIKCNSLITVDSPPSSSCLDSFTTSPESYLINVILFLIPFSVFILFEKLLMLTFLSMKLINKLEAKYK